MIALIMAAGKGKRMGKITEGFPKSLLKINGEQIIRYQVRILRKYGIKKIIIVVGYKKELIKNALKDFDDITYIYNPFYENCNVLGSAWFARDFLDEPFVYMHADTIFEELILKELIEANSDGVLLALDSKKCGEEEMKIWSSSNKIIAITKDTIDCYILEGEFIGVLKIGKNALKYIVQYISEIINNERINAFFEETIQQYIDNGYIVECIDVTGKKWNEIDFPEDYDYAKQIFI